MPKYLITVSGEIPLRSHRTRPRFYQRLIDNIEDAVEREGGKLIKSEILEAKILLESDREVGVLLAHIFGVHRVGRVLEYEFRDLKDLAEWVAKSSIERVRGKKFAVRVKRSGKHSFTSIDVAREVGSLLKPYSTGVDLENPEIVVEVEVRGNKVFLYEDSLRGPGGLPIGVEGWALVLFSGGFDSPVASWFTAKRGVFVDFLHFILGSTESTYYAFKIAQELACRWLYGYRPKFLIVDFRDVVAEVSKKVDWSYRQIALRALMYIAASKLAEKLNYDVLVTGESIGQTSSQTLRNLSSIERAVNLSKPILRPLIGFDKEEIIEYSRRIGLYDLSSRVFEACAIAPTRVATSASREDVLRELEKIDLNVLYKVLEAVRVYDLLASKPEVVVPESDLEIDFIPEDALVIDMRNPDSRRIKPIENATPMEEVVWSTIPRDKVIVLICKTGSASLLMAKTLREKGFKAYSYRGGALAYFKKACRVQ